MAALNLSCIEDLITDLQSVIPQIDDLREGVTDFLDLLSPQYQEEVNPLLKAYERRGLRIGESIAALSAARGALQTLVSDGHPDLPALKVSTETISQLDENLRTLTLARNRFSERILTTTGRLVAGPEEAIS